MKLEDQVCSLELAKKLRELGVKQESQFFWLTYNSGEKELIYRPADGHSDMGYSAFTVAELGEMLPKHISIKCKWGLETSVLVIGCVKGWWIISYRWSGEGFIQNLMHEKRDRSEADARAKMLIHLIETGVVNP